jgi:hypothetical protein
VERPGMKDLRLRHRPASWEICWTCTATRKALATARSERHQSATRAWHHRQSWRPCRQSQDRRGADVRRGETLPIAAKFSHLVWRFVLLTAVCRFASFGHDSSCRSSYFPWHIWQMCLKNWYVLQMPRSGAAPAHSVNDDIVVIIRSS